MVAQGRSQATDLFGDPIDAHPQWFDPASFLLPNFDSETYISNLRTFVPFETLRSELISHLTSLNVELVDLINRDYSDFVNLSSRLVDVDSSVVRMRAPLSDLKETILQFRSSLHRTLSDLTLGLSQRSHASKARDTLELLLDTFHVVSKVEKLIKELPSVPEDWSTGHANSTEKGSNTTILQSSENGTHPRETQSMLLERIASEMNRLRFYMAHAQNMPFIENMERRIQSASLLLDVSLGHCFVDGLEHRDANAVYNCLRAYAAIDNTKNAEEFFRTTIVAPFVHQIIPYGPSRVVNEASSDELENDYHQIKQCIEKDCKFLLNISFVENSGLHVFNFLANSILKEVLSAIQKGKPGAFSSGRPTNFLRNYKSSLDFLAHLEGYCPFRSAVATFRSEAVYVEFMKQWNIGVYFSLRFQEIAGELDSSLSGASLAPSDSNEDDPQNLLLKACVILLKSLRSCWQEDVLVLSCSDKFLRLSLQLLSRFASWLSSGLAAHKARSAVFNPGSECAISAVSEDFIFIIHDLNCLAANISGEYLEHVLQILKSCPIEVLDLVKESILISGISLKDLVPQVVSAIIEVLVERSVEDLRQVKGITATYRMTNKPLPSKHSPYVSGILRPLKTLLDGVPATKYLTVETRSELIRGTTVEITDRYYELASDLVSVAKKTESSLQRIRQGVQRRAGASSDISDHNLSDTDKICMQLFFDIQEYGRNLGGLGVKASEIPTYCSLWHCVAPQNTQDTISF